MSGQIPICNDEKEITGYRLKNADADITGEKAITYQKELTRQYIQKKILPFKILLSPEKKLRNPSWQALFHD